MSHEFIVYRDTFSGKVRNWRADAYPNDGDKPMMAWATNFRSMTALEGYIRAQYTNATITRGDDI